MFYSCFIAKNKTINLPKFTEFRLRDWLENFITQQDQKILIKVNECFILFSMHFVYQINPYSLMC